MGAAEITVVGSVVVALITGSFAVYIERLRRIGARREDIAVRELQFQAAALDFTDYMSEWNEINAEILGLFQDTNIDRFLLLRAWNGKLSPQWTTAFFQMRTEDQKPYTYTHVQLDDDYVERLRKTIGSGSIVFSVNDVPESLIKSIYNAEGVKHSAWFSIDRKELSNSDSVSLTYCSFATHDDEPLSDATLTRCRIIASRIKGVAASMNGGRQLK